jgi:hypothetical protein
MSLKTLVLAFLNTAKDDVILDALPLFGVAAKNIAGNDSKENEVAQLAQLQVSLLAAVPTLEQQLTVLVAGEVMTVSNQLVAQATADIPTQAAVISAQVTAATPKAGS